MAFRRPIFALLAGAALVCAQESKPEAPKPEAAKGDDKSDRPHGDRKGPPSDWKGGPKGPPPGDWKNPDAMRERMMKDMEKLTPEQRMEVMRAMWAVMNLPEDKRRELIGMDDERRKKKREEFEQMMKENEIVVEDGRRREFFGRYFHGRKEIESQILKEGEERRTALTRELMLKLKQDFAKPAEAK